MQRIARGLLYSLLWVIPFSKAGIEILFPLLLVSWLIGWHWPGRKEPLLVKSVPNQAILFTLFAYLGVCIWSVSYSTYPFLSIQALVRKTAEYLLFFVIVMEIADHPTVAPRSLRALLGAAWLVGIYAVIQQVAGRDPIRDRALVYSRMVGPYENPNDLATFLMVVGLVMLAHLLSRPKQTRISGWLGGLLILGCLAWTLSRGALIGLWAGLSLLLIYSRKRMVGIGLSVALAMSSAVLFFRKGQFFEMLAFSDAGLQERHVMWKVGWRMIQDRPFLGHGLNTFMANYLDYADVPNNGPAYAHNCLLQITAETGLLGLISFLLFLGSLFMVWNKALRKPAPPDLRLFLLGLVAGIAAFLVQSIFDTNLYALRQATLFWVLSGLAVGLSLQILRSEEIREE